MLTSAEPAPSSSDGGVPTGRRALRVAWVCVAAIPVCFVGAFLLGEGLITRLGYGSTSPVPIAAALAAATPAVLLMAAPGVGAAVAGFMARRRGQRGAILPAVIGLTVAAYAVVANALPLLLRAWTSAGRLAG